MGMKSGVWGRARQAARRSDVRGTRALAPSQGLSQSPWQAGESVLLGGDDNILLRALEPRILLDAAVAETGFELAEQMAQADAAHRFPGDDSPENGHVLDFRVATDNDDDPVVADGGDADPVEIVFIDGSLEDLDTIMAGIGPGYEAVFLSGDEDGVSQIARYLADRSDIDAIHIFAHGRSGTLELGNTKLTAASISGRHADDMAVISDALSADADILIYGCNFAAGTRGQTAVSVLMEASGADVTASDDVTGAAILGGDWDLEVTTGDIEAASIAAEAWDGLLASGGGADDGPVATTGNITTNINVLANDSWVGLATITHIIDPSDPGNPIPISVGSPIQLTTNTTIELLLDGTLDVTTSPLGHGIETFDYAYNDLLLLPAGQATVTLDRSQGSLINVPASVSGVEDNNIPLNITLDPALFAGGAQLDLIGTDTGFRDASAGATPTDFTIPPRTTAIRITAFGGYDNGAQNAAGTTQEDRQTFSVNVDLVNGTYSGHLLYVIGNNTNLNDNYAFSGVALGSDSDSATVTGDLSNNRNILTISRSGDTLSLVESQGVMDQAYLVEYLTADGTSSTYLDSNGAILDAGTDPVNTTATIATDANASFLVVTIQDGAGSSDSFQEDNGGGRIVVDLDTGLASGVVYGQVGRGGSRNVAYSFTDYDITSTAFILDTVNSGAVITGDTVGALSSTPNYKISMNGSDLVLERSSDFANRFGELINVQSYERHDVGSSASALGSDAVDGDFIHDQSINTWDLDIAGGAETGFITLMLSGINNNNNGEHDHGATARIFVDLVNNTTSGSFFLLRAENPDLIVWNDVPFGTRMIDSPNSSANFADLASSTIEMLGALQFDLISNPDGSQTLRASAQSERYINNNWYAVLQAQWSGREPVTISGNPNGGTFSAGSYNADTDEWEVDVSEISGLSFVPPEHFSGLTTTMIVDYNGSAQNVDVAISRVADAPVLAVSDATGPEDSLISIPNSFGVELVDQDGSETITLVEISAIPIGHTISDGDSNSFTASAGSQTVNITGWDRATLVYTPATNFNGTVTLNVRAQTTDDDGFSGTTDTAETTGTFDVIITPVNDAPVNTVPGAQTVDEDTALSISGVSVTDVDGNLATTQLTVTNGVLTVTLSGSAAISAGANGSATLTISGSEADINATLASLTYQGNTDYNGADTLTVVSTDSDGSPLSDTDTVAITINPVNDPPEASANAYVTLEDTPVGGNVITDDTGLGIDLDIDLDSIFLHVSSVGALTTVQGGTITLSANGAFTYTPPPDFNGTDTIDYILSDGLLTAVATLTFTVTSVNDAPVATGDSFETAEDNAVTIDVLANDDDVDGDTLMITHVDGQAVTDGGPAVAVSNGMVALVSGELVYTPTGDFNGATSFTYTISDGIASHTATVNGTVTPVDDASDDSFTSAEDAVLIGNVKTNDTYTGAVSYAVAGDVSNGVLVLNPDGSFTYTPDSNFTGSDVFTYEATDINGTVETQTVTISVTAVNDAPVATDDVFAINEGDGSATGNVITGNNGNGPDSDPDGDALAVSAVNGVAGNVGNAIAGDMGGLFTIAANGAFTFAENGSFEDLAGGETRTTKVTYTLDDGEGGQVTATVSVTVAGINDGPEVVTGREIADATGDDAETITPIDVKSAFNDPDGSDTLTYTATGLPAGLSLDMTAGIISGTIDSSASQNGNTGLPADGVYTVQVTASDGNGGMVIDTFTYTVSNPAPVAQGDAFSTDQDTAVTSENVLADNGSGADSDPDGDTPLVISQVDGAALIVGQPVAGSTGGVFTIAANGSLSFDPDGDFDYLGGAESANTAITYQLSDGEGGFHTATVTVTIGGLNDGPVPVDPANPGTPPTDPNNYIPVQNADDGETIAAFDVTPYVSDPDATDTLTFTIDPAELPPGLSFDGTQIAGTLTASASQGGDDPLTNPGRYLIPLKVTDGDGSTFTTTITYDIANPAPDARDDAVTTDEDSIITGEVFADNGNDVDSDPDGDTFTVSLVEGSAANVGMAASGANGGAFTINSGGSYSFDPGTDFRDLANGESRNTSITYTIDDGNGGTDQATFTVTVNGSNNAPVIIDPSKPVTDPNNPPVPADPNNFIPDQSGSDSTPLTPFDVSPYFHDFEDNPITFSLDVGAPPWLSIDPVTGVITGTPSSDASIGGPGSDGVYVITLIGTDSNGDSVSTTIDFAITNPPPVTTGLADQTEVAGTPFTMETVGSFSDPDGDTLTFSATGLPAGLMIDPVTGEITGTIDGAAASGGPNGNGVYTVSVAVDDGQGGTVTATFILTVADPPFLGIPGPSDPLPPVTGPGDPIILPEPSLVIGDLVNTISPLGGHTGIFDLSHPLTEALYQISPLAISPSLDPNGPPITQTVEWIEKTRAHLDRNGKTAWLTDKGLRDVVDKYYLGGDAAPGGEASDPIVRTLAWGPVLFIEIVSERRNLEWEMESVDGRAPGRDHQAYGANLFAVVRFGNAAETSVVLRGSDSDGNEILLEVDLLTANAQLVDVRASDGEDVAQGLSDQIRKLVQARKAATRSPFLTSG